jgi:hypothetical protein
MTATTPGKSFPATSAARDARRSASIPDEGSPPSSTEPAPRQRASRKGADSNQSPSVCPATATNLPTYRSGVRSNSQTETFCHPFARALLLARRSSQRGQIGSGPRNPNNMYRRDAILSLNPRRGRESIALLVASLRCVRFAPTPATRGARRWTDNFGPSKLGKTFSKADHRFCESSLRPAMDVRSYAGRCFSNELFVCGPSHGHLAAARREPITMASHSAVLTLAQSAPMKVRRHPTLPSESSP